MTAAVGLSFAAAAVGVLGAWEALVAVERVRLVAAFGRAVEPLVRAGREGRDPTGPERRRLALLSTAALVVGGWIVGGPAAGAVAAVGGPLLVAALVRSRRRRYARELRAGAAGAARALADAVGAGHSIRGAIAVAAGGITGAAGNELRATARALDLGDPTAIALEALQGRAGDPAWDAIVAGILLQRDAGGDLAGLLREQAAALEAADRIEREARTATAQARFTARLVLVLPLGAAVLAELASPGLIGGLVTHPLSVWLVAMAAALQVTAIVAVSRLARTR
jgi:tight adherence protein B